MVQGGNVGVSVKTKRLRRAALAALMVTSSLAAAGVAAPAQAQEAARDFDIPAQPLANALTAFGQQSGLQVSAQAPLVEGRTSSAVRGALPPLQALSQLLTGTGLSFRIVGSTVTLEPAPQSGDDAIQLGPVRVEGDNGSNSAGYYSDVSADSPVTEGTRSYTARQSSGSTGLSLSLRETPQSVSVMTRQRIEDQALMSLSDILRNAPGIGVSQLDSERTTFTARGFSISDFQYDGVSTFYRSNYAAGESEMDSIIYDRVEIIRGATGLMTGAGTPSAAVNMVRKRANSREQTGAFSLSAGSWDFYRATADISSPITPNGDVRVRLVGSYENKNGFTENYHRERKTVYGTVDADVTPDLTFSVGASYQRSDAEGVTYGGLPLYYSDGTVINWRSLGRSFSIWPKWSTEDVDIYNVFANAEYHFGSGWKLSLLGMYSKNEVENTRLFAWGYPDSSTGLMTSNPSRVQFPGDRTQHTADLRLTGPFHLAGREHEIVAGFNFSRNKAAFGRIGASDVAPSVSLFDWANYPEPASWGAEVSSETWNRRQISGYGALRLSIADPLKLIVGGRYTDWRKSGAGYLGRNPYEYEKTKLIPYAGIIFDIDRNWSAYASYTSIFNPQDIRDRNGDFLDPLTGDSYEAGVKGEFFDGRLNIAAALFRIQQDNLSQADTGYIVPGTTQQAYYGVKGARSQGVEAEISGEPLPGWNLTLSGTHFSVEDRNGARVNPEIARSQVRLFTTYRLGGALSNLSLGGGANWQSKVSYATGTYHSDAPVSGTYSQKAYVLANLMARYELTEKVSVQVNLNNLFDEYYQTGVNFSEQWVWGTPRNVLATLNFGF